MTQKIREIDENEKTNNIRDLYKGVNSLRKGYQPKLGMIRNERGELQADPKKILDVWKSYFDTVKNRCVNSTTGVCVNAIVLNYDK